MSGRLAGKVVLVTGGASGIGLATVEACAREDAVALMADIDTGAGATHAQRLKSVGLRVEFMQLDVTSEGDWRRVADDVMRRHGRLDVLVNNAGIVRLAPIEEETLEGWRRTQAVNMEGVFLGTRESVRTRCILATSPHR